MQKYKTSTDKPGGGAAIKTMTATSVTQFCYYETPSLQQGRIFFLDALST